MLTELSDISQTDEKMNKYISQTYIIIENDQKLYNLFESIGICIFNITVYIELNRLK